MARVEMVKIQRGDRPSWLSADIWKNVRRRWIDRERDPIRYRYEVVLMDDRFMSEFLLAVFGAEDEQREGDPLAVNGAHNTLMGMTTIDVMIADYEAGRVDGFKARPVPAKGQGRYR